MPREMVEIVYVVSLRRSYWMLEKVSRYRRCVDWRCELCSGATMYGYPTPCHDINERPISRNSQTPADDRSWLSPDVGAYVSRFGFRDLGAGSSAAVTRRSSPGRLASSHRSASINICGLAPGIGRRVRRLFGMDVGDVVVRRSYRNRISE
jgi:hypothetical protein